MTTDTTPAGRHVALMAGGAGLAILLAGGLTLAAWYATDTIRGAHLIAGDMSMTTGTPTWAQVTPGVSEPQSGTLTTTPTDFYAMPGDVIDITAPVTVTLTGKNLSAGLEVDLDEHGAAARASDAGRLTLSYHVEDAEGHQVAPVTGDAPLGTPLSVPGLSGDDDAVTSSWQAVVRVGVLGDYEWTDGTVTVDPDLWSAGDLTVRLRQVRDGAGFTTPGGSS